jgi:polyisoprenoid-binding protein YceI
MSIAYNETTDTALDRPARSAPATQTAYLIDPAASRIEFSINKRRFFVQHLVVTGRFSDVNGTITLDEAHPAGAQSAVTIGAASIDTGNKPRDKHLRKADFFHVDQHPTLTFQSRKVEAMDQAAGRYRVVGDLTVRGVTRLVTLEARYEPAKVTGMARRVKLTLSGSLNRRDFGIVWNNPLIQIADDLTVNLEVEATAE